MKNALKLSMIGALLCFLTASCDNDKGGGDGNGNGDTPKNYTETAFGMNLQMVYVAGGEFEMGSTVEQDVEAASNEAPVRTVSLDPYYIGKFEITQSQWEAVMGTTIREQMELTGWEELYGEGIDYPMYYVNWQEAKAFCDSLSKKTGKRYALPTEAQWEYAAKGGQKSEGYKYSGGDNIEEVAWYEENSEETTHPVGLKKANELGIFDMSGNVREWCSDWYDIYDEADTENPQGPELSEVRVERSGSFGSDARRCRSTDRRSFKPTYRSFYLGFRVVQIL
ncbi:MAG: formylglycine-generating enzyme family protein [Bacteroides sp.]|nr:formylglycine-generating enzyme family protein [Ruminococcus flavefaciens]MCM1554873.1 formylglycine-generating enzyme family protein [Bacteroides sp.]